MKIRKRILATAKRGAKFMDRHRPGWARRVKITQLDIGNGCKCILGQEFAKESEADELYPYDYGKSVLGLGIEDVVRLGFLAEDSDEELTEAWKEEIRARR